MDRSRAFPSLPAGVQVVDLVAYRQAAQAEASSAAMEELTGESERLNLGY